MTDIQNGTILTVQQFFNEVRAGQIVDAHTGRKLIKLDKDGKPKEGSAKIEILNKEDVDNFVAAPIYKIDTSLEGIGGAEFIECRQFILDCNKLSATVSVSDIPKSDEEIKKIQEEQEAKKNKGRKKETENKAETAEEFYRKEYEEDAKEQKVKKK